MRVTLFFSTTFTNRGNPVTATAVREKIERTTKGWVLLGCWTLFTALKLRLLKPWSVKTDKKSACTTTSCDSHVMRVVKFVQTAHDGGVGFMFLRFSLHYVGLRVFKPWFQAYLESDRMVTVATPTGSCLDGIEQRLNRRW